MGREARLRKNRTCKMCKRVVYATAREAVEHADLCTRATAAGLVLAKAGG